MSLTRLGVRPFRISTNVDTKRKSTYSCVGVRPFIISTNVDRVTDFMHGLAGCKAIDNFY